MENFCKHAEGHLNALNMAEEDEEEETEGEEDVVLQSKVSGGGSSNINVYLELQLVIREGSIAWKQIGLGL